jgi:hypothetical protein
MEWFPSVVILVTTVIKQKLKFFFVKTPQASFLLMRRHHTFEFDPFVDIVGQMSDLPALLHLVGFQQQFIHCDREECHSKQG